METDVRTQVATASRSSAHKLRPSQSGRRSACGRSNSRRWLKHECGGWGVAVGQVRAHWVLKEIGCGNKGVKLPGNPPRMGKAG